MGNKLFLHISEDNIFLDNAIEQFEAVSPNKSIYLVNTEKPKHIKNIDKIIAAESNSNEYKSYINQLDNFDAVILHALTYDKVQIVNNAPKSINFVWMLWGADGFYIKEFEGRWYSKETKQLIDNLEKHTLYTKIRKHLTNNKLYNLYFFLRKNRFPADVEKVKAMKRINYIAPVIEDDFYIIKEKLKLKSKLLPFSYGSIETLIPNSELQNSFHSPKENKILLGNSADPSNNHIDVFYLLKDIGFKGGVICPLSYGNPAYKEKIISKGEEILGSSFKPITKFLPLQKYQEIIQSCNIVIMNHYRQQAMGNIISSIWYGSKLYINDKSIVYSYLKRIGVKIFSIQNLTANSNIYIPLENEVIIKNREIIEEHYSKEKVTERTKHFVNILLKKEPCL